MPAPIEDYALLSNCRTAALVSREGSVDWLCMPRFDSASMFAALLGDEHHGCWSLRPTDAEAAPSRSYDGDTFILVTRWECASGVAEVHEFLPIDGGREDLVRRVIGISGSVEFTSDLRIRFDYARTLPWVRQAGTAAEPALLAMGGPDGVIVRGPRMTAEDHVHRARFTVEADDVVDSTLTWFASYTEAPDPLDIEGAWEKTREWWSEWASGIEHHGPHHEEVIRSMLMLRALTHQDTGGIVAAATTSLPEDFGGSRNWDYRYVWLRDAALTLEAYIAHGYLRVAQRWRRWLLRAVAGDPADVQIMYGLSGERDLAERDMDSLPGYEGASPVHVGNGAVDQWQADVIGEVMVALEEARMAGLEESEFSWPLQQALLEQLAVSIDKPDHGIWEIRGPKQKFTHSRAMLWAAFDRGVRAVEDHGFSGDVDTWRDLRDRLRTEIETEGVSTGGFFVQHYGGDDVDASLLLLPQVGFCDAGDPRMLATVAEMERTLMRDGFLLRYRTSSGIDGLPGDEHPFLACSFWLVEQYAESGRTHDAADLMARLCALTNDVGMLSEEYDVGAKRHAGNTPQALSHLALVRAADALVGHGGRAANRH